MLPAGLTVSTAVQRWPLPADNFTFVHGKLLVNNFDFKNI
jgi:hypothetical protein